MEVSWVPLLSKVSAGVGAAGAATARDKVPGEDHLGARFRVLDHLGRGPLRRFQLNMPCGASAGGCSVASRLTVRKVPDCYVMLVGRQGMHLALCYPDPMASCNILDGN
jgi:hypothetical protein